MCGALSDLVGRDEAVTGQHVDTVLPGLRPALYRDGLVDIVPAGATASQRSYQPQSTPLYHHDVYRGQLVVLRDVTLQQTRERTLEALRSATERLLDATDSEAVADIATETAQRALGCPYSGVVRYDEREDRLRPVALTDELSTLLDENELETDAEGGPGISEKFRGEVFSPGVTADESGTIGFGLYFVKVIMEEYGGHVRFETNGPRGTVAVLTFEQAASGETDRKGTAEAPGHGE